MKKIFFILSFILFVQFSAASAEKPPKTMYAGAWFPNLKTGEKIDKSLFADKDVETELGRYIRNEIKNNPALAIIKDRLNIYFPEESKIDKESNLTRIFGIILSRATDNSFEYNIEGEKFYKHFFDVTLSVVVINPRTSIVDYSRILTGEYPVVESNVIDLKKKNDYFLEVLQKTVTDLLNQTANEFKTNYEEDGPIYYFQLTHLKIKPDAEILADYENDLKQFLHDALIIRARERNTKVYFLPPKFRWNAKLWQSFINRFNVDIESYEQNRSEKIRHLIEQEMLLTISSIVFAAKKGVIKEKRSYINNEILEASHVYTVYTGGGVVLRDIYDKKAVVYPTKITAGERVAKGSGKVVYHDIKDLKNKKDKSEEIMYLDAAQKAMANLSKDVINLCDLARQELQNK